MSACCFSVSVERPTNRGRAVSAEPSALIDGQPGDRLALSERGFQYGDGLFESIAVRDGRGLCWERHMERLLEGCRRLRLPFPEDTLLRREAGRLMAGTARGVLKIYWTRGCGGRGYEAPEAPRPTRILGLHPWPARLRDYPARGLKVRFCDLQLGWQPALAGLKHLNRLEQVLARGEWRDPSIHEGLMFDRAGHVVEGTMSNLFLGLDGTLCTPALERCGVAGVLRAEVLAAATELGLPHRTGDLTREDLERADELFLCNSLMGIRPVAELPGRLLRPGPLAARLRTFLQAKGRIMPV